MIAFAAALLLALTPPEPAGLQRLDPPAAPGSLAVNVARSGETVLVSWLEPEKAGTRPGDEGARYALKFSRLENGSWTPAVTIYAGGDVFLNWADVPTVVDAGDGRLVATYAIKTGSLAYDVGLMGSKD